MQEQLLTRPSRPVSWVAGVVLSILILMVIVRLAMPFFEAIAWAIVIAVMTWPVHHLLQHRCKMAAWVSALLMTAAVAVLVIGTLAPLVLEVGREVYDLSAKTRLSFPDLVQAATDVPFFSWIMDSEGPLAPIVKSGLDSSGGMLIELARRATQGLFGSFILINMTLFVLFFLYRDGEHLLKDARAVMLRYAGPGWISFLSLAGATIRGVVYGALVTALAQGLLAGAGFYVSGAPLPALLGFATVLASFVPFGAPMIYVPVAAYLALKEQSWYAGAGLFIWGVAIVSTIDNLIRPLFISHSTKMPLLLVVISIIGGILAFGLIGLFIGPVVFAVGLAAWQQLVRGTFPVSQSNSSKTP